MTRDRGEGVAFEPYERPGPHAPGGSARRREEVQGQRLRARDEGRRTTSRPRACGSYAVNGKFHRGTGASAPIVVNQGDKVELTLVNGGSERWRSAPALDRHPLRGDQPRQALRGPPARQERSASVFSAKHAGVLMYHCATQPVLMHTGTE